MTTLNEMIAILKAKYPNGLRVGDETDGYTQLSDSEYEATIAEWAAAKLAKQASDEAKKAQLDAKAALLERLGLTEQELQIILG